MPSSPCLEPWCPNFATYRGRCETHAPERERETHGARRNAEHRKVYATKRWRITRRRKLTLSPVCEECGTELAREVDHVLPLEEGGAPYAMGNLRALCSRCHGRKTGREIREREYR